jgi:hypothetical protein
VRDVAVVLLAMHCWVAVWKLPFEFCSAESPPRTTSNGVAPETAVHARSTFGPLALLTVRRVAPTRLQRVTTRYGLGPVDEKVIHPAFSDQARPLKIPVQRSITTPAPVGAKRIQPAFSDHA